MKKFLDHVAGFTTVRRNGVDVRGRLLTVDSVNLTAGRAGFPRVTAERRGHRLRPARRRGPDRRRDAERPEDDLRRRQARERRHRFPDGRGHLRRR